MVAISATNFSFLITAVEHIHLTPASVGSGKVKGKLLDSKTMGAIGKSIIKVYTTGNRLLTTGVSDDSGNYLFDTPAVISTGYHYFEIKKVNYHAFQYYGVNVTNGQTFNIDDIYQSEENISLTTVKGNIKKIADSSAVENGIVKIYKNGILVMTSLANSSGDYSFSVPVFADIDYHISIIRNGYTAFNYYGDNNGNTLRLVNGTILNIEQIYLTEDSVGAGNLKGDLAAETQENIIGSIVRVYNKNKILVMTGKIKADGTYDFAVPVGVDYYFHIIRPNYTRFVYHNLSIITGLNNIDKIYLNLASIGTSTVKGLLRNADDGVISGSVVRIYNKAGYLVMTGLADALGTYDFAVPVGIDYYIRTVRTGYTDFYYYGVNVILNQIYNVENLYLSLATLGTGTLKGKLSLDSGVVSGTVVRIYNKSGRLIMTTIAGADGAYQFFVPTGVDYYLRIIRTGYTDFYYYGINVVINNIFTFSEIFKVYSSSIGVGYYSGVYLDAETQKPVANTIVRIYADDGVTVVATGLTDINGYYYITVPTGINYYYRYYTYVNNSYIYYRTYRGLTFTPNYYYYSQPYYYIAPQLQGKGTIAGSAINGLNRDRVQGLTVKLREGVNNKTEAPILTTTTGAKGFYSFQDVDAGLYTIEVSGTGYATTYYSALVYGSNVNQSEHNIIVTQKLNPGQTRVVLFWGSRPSDLDLHLTGPDTGEDRFHLSFDNKGSSTASPFATYDADFFGGYGPEVVTIHNQKPGGVYRFSVHDYTNQASTTANKSWALSYSSARVYIYNSSGYVNSFWVPYNSNGGNLWTAFELKDEVITPVNTMSYVSSGFNIQSRGSSVNDSSFIRRSSSKKR